MDIVCPNCAATYEVDGSALTEQGRKVRCTQCQTVWRVFPALGGMASPQSTPEPRIAEPVLAESMMAESMMVNTVDMTSGSGPETDPAAGGLDQDELDKLFGDMDAEPSFPQASPVELAAIPMTMPVAANDAAASAVSPLAPELGPDSIVATNAEPASAHAEPDPVPAPMAGPRAKLVRATKVAQEKPPGMMKKLMSLPVAGTLMVLAVLAGGILQKQRVVEYLPQTAKLYAAIGMPVNLRGIEIANVKSRLIDDNGIQVLVVDGDLRNVAGKQVPVPRLRFSVLGEKGDEIYAWSAQADKNSLNPGESINFRRRLAAPPQDGHRVNVRFLTAADITAGISK
jgi:predicted Zn finger-like uncharacterized protein